MKELLVCPCGNSKNEIYAEIEEDYEVKKIFIRCPKCGKESLVANLV
jgi:ribosomal protein S27AE